MMKKQVAKKQWNKAAILSLLMPFILVFAAFLFAALLMLMVGNNPLAAYKAMFLGAFGTLSTCINTLNKAVPICIAAFAVSISRRCGIFNIGVEGQLQLGALGSVLAGIFFTGLPPVIHIPLTLLCGMLFGALWSLLPAALLVERKVNVIVLFLFMNNIATLFLQYFIFGPLQGKNSAMPSTDQIQESARLPNLITSPNKLSISIILVVIVAVVLHIFVNKTYSGYELRATGMNKTAAACSGINVKKYMYLAVLIPGLLGGLAGSIEITGRYYRLIDGFSPGYGFDGIPIALLAGGNPIGTICGGILFAAMRVGSLNMQAQAGVSSLIVQVIQGFLVLAVAAEHFVRYLILRKSEQKEAVTNA